MTPSLRHHRGTFHWGTYWGHAAKRGFHRGRLPSPIEYFHQMGLQLSGRGDWQSALCPFHDDDRPSLRVKVDVGAFKCMACGARGGDVLAFHMRRFSLSFVEAAKALGAWEGR